VGEGEGSSLLIEPAKVYDFTSIYITPDLIAIYSGATFDVVNLRLAPTSDTKEIYFKQVVGVDYAPPTIEIKTAGGGALKLVGDSDQTAHAIVGEIRSRLRAAHA